MIVLLGKSCSGKTTIQRELEKLGLSAIVTYTTRPKRENEINGVTYNFISEEYFNVLKDGSFFAITSTYNVANGETWMYGTAMKDLADNKVIITNPKEFSELKNLKSDNLHPVSFYLSVNKGVIWHRLLNRGDSIEEALRRIDSDREDFLGIEHDVDIVIKNNGKVELDILANIIKYSYERIINGNSR